MIASTILPLLAATLAPADAGSFAKPINPVSPLADEEKGWSGSVTAGANIRTGNTENKSASLTAGATWRGEENRFTAEALWNYQEDNVSVIQRKVYGSAQLDHFYDDATYSYAKASGDHDNEAALKLRWTGGIGLGHQIRDDSDWNISAEGGLSYVDEEYEATSSGAGSTVEYFSARLAYNMAYLASDRWEFSHGGEVFPSLENSDDVYARWDTKVKTNLTDAMFAQLQSIWDYDNTPAEGKGRNDSLFALTVGWSF